MPTARPATGAGLHVEIPQDFFKEYVRDASGHSPDAGRIAVGMVFLPRTDLRAQERCRTIVETEVLRFGHSILAGARCRWIFR